MKFNKSIQPVNSPRALVSKCHHCASSNYLFLLDNVTILVTIESMNTCQSMASTFFKNFDKKTYEFIRPFPFFFQFLGESVSQLLRHGNRVAWRNTIITNLQAGSSLVIPLILISMLIGMALTVSIHFTLARFHLQEQAMVIIQTTMIRDIAPLPIGFILCVHCGLNLIEKDHPSLHQPPKVVLLETIIPLFAGINITALLLYTYVFTSFLCSVFITSYFILETNTDEYLLRLSQSINPLEIIDSLIKTFIYATIASLIAGFYYYAVANNAISTRQAVSRIITRSLFWLIVVSVLFKLSAR